MSAFDSYVFDQQEIQARRGFIETLSLNELSRLKAYCEREGMNFDELESAELVDFHIIAEEEYEQEKADNGQFGVGA